MESGINVDSAGRSGMRRKLAVILASDVASYSRLVAADEEDTVRRFRAAAAGFCEQVQKYRGRVFNTAGDAILAEFESAVDATRCALDIQDANNAQNAAINPSNRLLFRIGIAIGDVLVSDDGDLLGDGVNIAARLEGIAEPGGVCISDEVKTHVLNKIGAGFVDLGEQRLKNIPRSIRAYRLGRAAGDASQPTAKSARRFAPSLRVAAAVLASALIVAGTALGIRYYSSVAPDGVSSPVLANVDRPFDPGSVPLVTDRVRNGLVDYAQQPDFKAVAISHSGWGVSSGLPDSVSAERDALERCRRRDPKGDCRIYARGAQVVWPTLPPLLAADLHRDPLDAPLQPADYALVKGMPNAAWLEGFLHEKNHKALAIGDPGLSFMSDRADVAEAIRLVVDRCGDAAKVPCLLVSVDGFLTVRIPRSHGVVRPYTLTGETEMSGADKARIGQIYAGSDWRALAKGSSGHWYAVNAADSEMAAADRVLQQCQQAEPTCELRAIGNFRVAGH